MESKKVDRARVGLLVLTGSPGFAQDLSKHFDGITGTFVLLNAQTGAYVRHNPERAAQRFAPCSTFKIPHTAVLLETGIAPDPEFVVKYDPAYKQEGAWARDHTLRSAYRVSALWYFRVLGSRVGLPDGATISRAVRLWQSSPQPGGWTEAKGPSGLTARSASRPTSR